MVALLHPQNRQLADANPAERRAPRPRSERHLASVPALAGDNHASDQASPSLADLFVDLDRRVVAVLATLVLGFVMLTAVQGRPPADLGVESAPTVAAAEASAGEAIIIAQSGDTYWGIAASLVSDGDIRPVVERLVERNGGANLLAGQRVIVPADLG